MNDVELRQRFEEWAAPLRATPPPQIVAIKGRARRRAARISGAAAVALAVVAVVTGVLVSGAQPTKIAASRAAPPVGDRAQALALGSRVLSAIRLPVGSQRYDGLPLPAPLRGLQMTFAGSVDPYAIYRIPLPMPAAARYLQAHLAADLVSYGLSQARKANGPATMATVTSDLRRPPEGIAELQLHENVVPGPGRSSLLLADALVTWYPPRSAAEQLTVARFRAILVIGERARGAPVTVDVRGFAAAVIGALDRQPAMPGRLFHSCPPITQTYRLVLVPALPSQPTVVVNATGCQANTVTVGGKPQPTLQDANNTVYKLTAAFLRGKRT